MHKTFCSLPKVWDDGAQMWKLKNSLIMHDRSDVSDQLQVTDNVTWFLSSMSTFPYFLI